LSSSGPSELYAEAGALGGNLKLGELGQVSVQLGHGRNNVFLRNNSWALKDIRSQFFYKVE